MGHRVAMSETAISTDSSHQDQGPSSIDASHSQPPQPVTVVQKPDLVYTNGQPPPRSLSSWRLYNGPKLYVKPTKKLTNHQVIHKAINKALEGAANAATLKKMQDTIQAHLETCNHFLILFRNYQFKGIFNYDEQTRILTKLDGIGPKSISAENIVKFFKYDSTKRQFTEVQTKQIGPTIVAITIAEPRNKPIPIGKSQQRNGTDV